MNTLSRLLVAAFTLGVAAPADAQTQPADLSSATLEELMNIEITSASRKEQRAQDVPAAVYVITHDDIRRSGMTSVPDLLRLAPGVQVAQINSNKWAVSVRGFNSLYSNKLLVLVDGRTVYTPLFSGVLWDGEDLMLEDVDRIEVIRGAGAAVWGANAVNAVINILTRPAADTKGLLIRAGTGTWDPGNLALRYGGAAGSGAYRVYAQFTGHGDSRLISGADADDHWRSFTSGFRGDWATGPRSLTLQGGLSIGAQRPLWVSLDPSANGGPGTDLTSDTRSGNLAANWARTRNGSRLQLQSFLDVAQRRESIGEYDRYTADFAADYHTVLARRHDLIAGGGYRVLSESIDGGPGYSFTPDHERRHRVNVFAQDEISLAGGRVALTAGAKFEHGDSAGSSLQPTARVMWKIGAAQRAWAAASRALRTPSLTDRAVRVDFPPMVPAAAPGATDPGFPLALSVLGNPAIKSERFNSAEIGYRIDISTRAAIDVVGFGGHYDRLQTTEPQAPNLIFVDGRPVIAVSGVFENLLKANTRGAEIAARLTVMDGWQADATFSAFHLTPHPDPASRDTASASYDGHASSFQWRGHSAWTLGPRAQADVLLFYVGPLRQLAVPAYTRADLRLEWKLTPRLSVSAHGQNLLDSSHVEFVGDFSTIVSTQVPRSGSLRLTWRF